jgi:dihydrofolate reductase
MRKLVFTTFMTLDGVFENPGEWSAPYWSDETRQFKRAELFASDALLLGRATYDGFAEAWPTIRDEDGFSERMNALPKYVASATARDLAWNNSRAITGNVAEEVARLKAGDGGDLLIYGSGVLTRSLLPYGLIDEFRFLLYPLLQGTGKRLFPGGSTPTGLTLVETRPFESGVCLLTYRPAAK